MFSHIFVRPDLSSTFQASPFVPSLLSGHLAYQSFPSVHNKVVEIRKNQTETSVPANIGYSVLKDPQVKGVYRSKNRTHLPKV